MIPTTAILVMGMIIATFVLRNAAEKKTGPPLPQTHSSQDEYITVYVGDESPGPRVTHPTGNEKELTSFLTEKDARYLQDVEHYGGFVLGDLAFPLVADALRLENIDSLTNFFHPEFTGSLFQTGTGKTRAYPFAEFSTWKETKHPVEKLNRGQFVKRLLQYRTEFNELNVCGVKVIKMNPRHSRRTRRSLGGNLETPSRGPHEERRTRKTGHQIPVRGYPYLQRDPETLRVVQELRSMVRGVCGFERFPDAGYDI